MKRLLLSFLVLLLVCASVPLRAQDPNQTKFTLYISSTELGDQLSVALSNHHFSYIITDEEAEARYRLRVTTEPLGTNLLLRAEPSQAISTTNFQHKWEPTWTWTKMVKKLSPATNADDVVRALEKSWREAQARARAQERAQYAARESETPRTADPPSAQPVYQALCCRAPFGVPATGYIIVWSGMVQIPNAHLVGTFSASGGAGNDIVVLVGDPINLQNALNGHPAEVLYRSPQLSAGSIDVPLPAPGPYAIAFTNAFSLVSGKVVAAQLALSTRGQE